jgi:hypothetical protein
MIDENEESFRAENQNRKRSSAKQNEEAIEKSLNFYCQEIKAIIEENVFLIDEKFDESEKQSQAEALRIFSDNSTGNRTYKQKFLNKLNSELEHKRIEVLNFNKDQMRKTIYETELNMKKGLDYYTVKMENTLNSFCGNEDIQTINKNFKAKTYALVEANRLLKDSNQWSQYLNKLDSDIDKLFVNFLKNFERKLQNLEKFYCEVINKYLNTYLLVCTFFLNIWSIKT